MKSIDPCIQKPWHIPTDVEDYLTSQIERTLCFLNRNCRGNFYMIDYFRQRLFSSSASTLALSGYPKNFIDKKDMDFYLQSINSEEQRWLHKLNAEFHRVFYEYEELERLNLEFSYELTGRTVNQQKIILRHKILPFRLCKNGNLWMALCFVTESPLSSRSNKATLINFVTGDKYEFNNKTFVKSKNKILTGDEVAILRCLSKGLIEKQISDLLSIPRSSLGRKKQSAFAKLGAKTAAEAIFLAYDREII